MPHIRTGARRRRTVLLAAVVPLLLALTASCSTGTGSGTGGAERQTIRVGNVCGGINVATVAMDADTFPDDVQVKKVCFDGGAEAVQALLGGGVDVFIGSTEHVVSTRGKGLPVTAYAALTSRVPYSLVSANGSGAGSVRDLRGKTVAVTSPGSLSDTELEKAASDSGVPYKSLEVIGAGSGASMLAAISKGKAAAGMVSEPQLSQLLRTGKYKEIWTPDFDYAALVPLAKTTWVKEHRKAMTGFLQGLRTAETKSRADESFAVRALKKEKFEVSDRVLRRAVHQTLGITPKGLAVGESVYRDTTGLLVDVGRAKAGRTPAFSDAFDFGILDQAEGQAGSNGPKSTRSSGS
ncbi:NitT/TauT family transport system substrate-binding protein [Streptomyces sp. Amel2xB2]|uniref:ABC transporter substrate-binding protein n=1 Tax=Streptomyces sp. Amel2xB2 TaxID=1305829 RepID=UPI000DBA1A8D|nr:ABC transporter substrate-binding protein [Streptomyces sp. Amel2xB2]RAJ68754.1 NitT/TauT family transport system substrate-binding protein [Streptomyces sp. Amel2xB2]